MLFTCTDGPKLKFWTLCFVFIFFELLYSPLVCFLCFDFFFFSHTPIPHIRSGSDGMVATLNGKLVRHGYRKDYPSSDENGYHVCE
jgi:hypothetical protein